LISWTGCKKEIDKIKISASFAQSNRKIKPG